MLKKTKVRKLIYEVISISIVVLLLTLLVSNYFDSKRIQQTKENLRETEIQTAADLAEIQFIDLFDKKPCEIEKRQILSNQEELLNLSSDTNRYRQRILSKNIPFIAISAKEQSLQQISLMLKAIDYNQRCDSSFDIMTYYYNGLDESFDTSALTTRQYQKSNSNSTLLFTIDIQYADNPMIEFLISNHTITGERQLNILNTVLDHPIRKEQIDLVRGI